MPSVNRELSTFKDIPLWIEEQAVRRTTPPLVISSDIREDRKIAGVVPVGPPA